MHITYQTYPIWRMRGGYCKSCDIVKAEMEWEMEYFALEFV